MTSEDPMTFDLVARAQRGDDDAIEQLIQRHLSPLRAFVRARSGAALRLRESSSDLVQSACREVLQGLDGFEWRGEGSFRHWLFGVALNKLRTRAAFHGAVRRDPAREAAASDAAQQLAEAYASVCSPSQNAIANELVANVEAALDRLPQHYREVILLSRIVGLSIGEIGEQLGKTENAVSVTLNRALAKLAGAMRVIERDSRT